MTTTIHPQTYIHPNPLATLAPHLLPHLPFSLPLLRRLQFHTSSPSARIIATFPPSPSTSPTPSPTATTPPPTSSFAATYADRTRAPETECWLFSTFETLPPSPPPTPSQHRDAKAQCLALLAGIARLPGTRHSTVVGSVNESLLLLIIGGEVMRDMVPQSVVSRGDDDDDDDDGDGTDTGTGSRKGINENENENINVISSISVPYLKWLIAPPNAPAEGECSGEERLRKEENGNAPSSSSSSPSLPPAYAFSPLRRAELPLTISRTAIPKTEATLAQLGCVCVRYTPVSTPTPTSTPTTSSSFTPTPTTTAANAKDKTQSPPIAWAFLGVDGSLTSLHVEPAHRGLGLAKAVARRLFRCLADDAAGMGFRAVINDDGDDEDDRMRRDEGGGGGAAAAAVVGGYDGGGAEGWAHSDVAEDNFESAGVAKALGGREGWRVRWVSVDLAAAVRGR